MRLAGGPVDFELLISQPYEDYNHDSRFFLAPGAQKLSKYEAMPGAGSGAAGVVASVPTDEDDELADELAADGPDVDAVREKEALAMKAAETQKRLANAEGDDLLALRADVVREAAGDEHGGAEKAGEGVVAGAAKAASPVVLGGAGRDAAASKEGKAQAATLLATAKQGGQPSFAFVAYPGSFPAAKKDADTQVKRKAEDAKFVGCASSKARQGTSETAAGGSSAAPVVPGSDDEEADINSAVEDNSPEPDGLTASDGAPAAPGAKEEENGGTEATESTTTKKPGACIADPTDVAGRFDPLGAADYCERPEHQDAGGVSCPLESPSPTLLPNCKWVDVDAGKAAQIQKIPFDRGSCKVNIERHLKLVQELMNENTKCRAIDDPHACASPCAWPWWAGHPTFQCFSVTVLQKRDCSGQKTEEKCATKPHCAWLSGGGKKEKNQTDSVPSEAAENETAADGNSSASDAIAKERVKPASFRSGLEEMGLIDQDADLEDPPTLVRFSECDVPGAAQPDEAAKTDTSVALPAATDAAAGAVDDIAAGVGGGAAAGGENDNEKVALGGAPSADETDLPTQKSAGTASLLEIPSGTSTSFQDTGSLDPGEEAKQRAEAAIEQENEEEPGEEQSLTANENEKADDQHDPASSSTTVNSDADANSADTNAESKPTLVHQPRANDLKTTDVPVPLRAQASQYKRVKAEFEETVRARFKPHESPYPDTIRLLPRKSPHLPVGTHDPALLALLANTLGKKPAYVPGRCISTTGEVVHISGGGGGGGGAEDLCGKNRTSAACGVDPGNCVWTIALPPPPVAWNPTGHCRAKAPIDDNEDIQDVCAGKEEKNCGEECEWVVEEETESGKTSKGKTEDGDRDEAEDIIGEDEEQDRPEDTAGTGLGFAAAPSTRGTRRSAAELRRAKKNGGTCRFQPDLDREECVQKSSSKSDCLQDAKCAYLKLPPQVLEPAYCASKFHAKGVKNGCDDYTDQESCDQHWSSCDWRAAVYDTTTTEYGVCKGDAGAKILCSGFGLNDVDYDRCTALPQCQWHHGSGCADGTEKTTLCGHCEENKTLNYKCGLITEQERCGGEESLLHLDHEGKPTVEEKKLSQVCRWDTNEEKHQPDKWHCVPKGDVARKTCLAHAEQADCESAPKSEQCQWVHLHGGCTYLQHSRDRKLCENSPDTLAKELPTSPDKYCCDNDATAPVGNIENASATTGDTTSTSTNISMQPSRKHLERPPYLVQEKACLTSWTPSDEDEGNGRQPPGDDSAKRDPVTGDALCRFTDEKAAVQHAFCRPNRDNGILSETQEKMLEDMCGHNEDRKACLRYSSCEWEDPRPHVCKYKPDVASDECSDVNYAYEQYAEEKCRENENCRWDVAKQMCRLDYEANRETCAKVNEGILPAVEDNSAGAATTSEEQTDTSSFMSSTVSSVQENCEAAGPSCTWAPFNPSEDERAVLAVLRNRQAEAEEQRKAVNELLFPKKPVQAVAHEVDLQLVQRPSLAAACLRESMFSRRAYFTESTGKHVLAFFPKLSGWEHADNAFSLADQMQQDAADAEKDGGAGEGVGGIVVGGGGAAATGPGVAVGSGDGPEGTNPKEESEKGGDETLAAPAGGAEVGSAAGEGGENEGKTGDSLAAATPDGTTRVDLHEGGSSDGAGSSSVSGSEGVSSGVVSTGLKRASVVNATGSGPDDAEELEPAGFPRPKLGTCYTATARVHATGAEVFQKLRQNFREAPDGDSDMLSMFRGRVDFARDQKWRASGTDMLPFLYHEYHVLEILKGVLTALKDLHTVKWGRAELAHLFGGEKFVPKRSLYGMQHRDVATLQNLVYDTKKPGFLSAEPDAAAGADDVQSGLADVKLTGFSLAKVIGTRVDFLRDAYANFVADAHAEAEAEAARVPAPTRITNYFKETKREMAQAFEEGLEEDEQENTGEKDPATQADGTAAKDEQTPGPAAEGDESETGTAAGLADADAVGDGSSKSPEPVVAAASKSNGLGGGVEQGEHRAPAIKFFTSSDYEPPVPTRLLLSAGPETYHDGVASAQEDYHMLGNSLLRYACVMKKDFAEQFTYGAAVRELTHPQPKAEGTGKIAALVNAGQRVLNYLREMSPMASTATLPANDALLQGPESLADVVAAGGTGVSGFFETARRRGASHEMSQGESGLMKSMATSLAEKAGIPPSQVEALLEKVPSRTSTSDDKASPAGAAAAASAAGAAAEKAGGVIEQGDERDDAASGTTTNIKHWDRLFPLHGQPVDDATQQFSRLPLADLDDETFVYQCPREPADVETTRTPAHPALVNLLASLRRLSHPHTRKARFSMPPSPARVDHCVDDLLARLKQAMDLLRRIESLEEKSQAERWSGRSRLLGNSALTAEETQFLDTHEREKILRVALQIPPSCRLEENALGPSSIDLPAEQGAFWKKYSDYMKWYTTIVPAPNDAPVWTSTKSGGLFNTNISGNLNAISGKIGGISGKIGGIFAS
eukprot:g1260.t1